MDILDTKMKECKEWYDQNKALYKACGSTIKNLLIRLLEEHHIPYHAVRHRVKEEKRFLEKCENPKYTDPISQITDVCGLRIITYTNADVKRIQEIITQEFEIDSENSVDKREIMQDNQVGYLSVHYIATINKQRSQLAEYRPYSDIKFEIQIRTLLQHAWAEIEHDRSYKFSGELPHDLKRRFYLVAGTLELLDREFEKLSSEIDEYAKEVRENVKNRKLDVSIDSTSLLEYLSVRLQNFQVGNASFGGYDKDAVEELRKYGIDTLGELDAIISDDILQKLAMGKYFVNYWAVLRGIMMTHDPEKFFNQVWNHSERVITQESYDRFVSINPAIEKFIAEAGIEIWSL